MKKAAAFLTSLLLAAALLFSGATALADEMIKPTDSFFVADYANVIDEADENHIIDRSAALSEATGAQIVIATVDYIGSTPIDDYCYELFNEWGIGDKDEDNGVLLLMVIGAEDYYIIAGTGLGQLLPGGVLGNMLDEYLEPDFAAGDYSAGAVKIFDELYDSVASYYEFGTDASGQTGGVSAAEPVPTPEPAPEQEKSPKRGSFIFILIGAVILLILISNVRRKARRVTGFNSAPPRGPGSFGAPPPRGFGAPPPPPRGFGAPPPPPGGFGAPPRGPGSFGGSSYRRSGFSSDSSAGRSSGFSSGSSAGRSSGFSSGRSSGGFSGGGGSTRGGGAGRGRR